MKTSRSAKKTNRYTERDLRILKHVAEFRMTTADALIVSPEGCGRPLEMGVGFFNLPDAQIQR